MELNFSSVETIPSLNASAAFQVDSGKVFKEDVDMVPTIIDKSLSYMPWGGDNMMPYNILKLIEDDEPSARQSLQHESPRQRWRADDKPLSNLSTCQQFNAEVCYGSGINSSMLGIEELMSKGERVTSNDYRRICREIEEFTLDNALPSYFLGVCQDFKQLNNLLTLGNVQTSLTLHSLNRRFRLLCLGNHSEHRGHED